MEWVEEVHRLLNQSSPEEALALVKAKVSPTNEMANMVLSGFDQRLSAAALNLEKGSKLMSDALVEKTMVQFEMKRLLSSLEEGTNNMDKPAILFLSAKPQGMSHLKIDSEYATIKECIQDGKVDFSLPIKSKVKTEDFATSLLKHSPKYLHFSGHGVTAVPHFNGAGIVMEAQNMDPIVPANEAVCDVIKKAMETIDLKGVILNACHSHSLALKISNLGVYAVGMFEEIADDSAIEFSRGFYANFGILKEDFIQSFGFGISQIKMSKLPTDASVPVLYHSGNQINS